MRLSFIVCLVCGLLALASCSNTATPLGSTDSASGELPQKATASSAAGDDAPGLGQTADETHRPTKNHGGADGRQTQQVGPGDAVTEVADQAVKPIAVGDKVPQFEVTIDGKSYKLSDLQSDSSITADGTLLLTFWCSFCHSCRDVEQELNQLAEQFQGQAGVIALDASAGETTEDVAAFAKQNHLTLPIAINGGGTAADIFGTRVTTTTVVIDADGVLRYCGQFADRDHRYAEDALKAVLAGEEVPVKNTRQKG